MTANLRLENFMGGAVVSIVTSQQEDSRFELPGDQGLVCP